ncbi:hypothetical protein ZHAS_00021792 [Anopheles sinensis]|uniref:Uncharacterized protein n=1 Tax=Anopheles sinensis TaxID=74873 RepID=A0A084WTL5_ANOSI|nr:hypothetical protein ZHAS_00021792 [Anopheles sinensis]
MRLLHLRLGEGWDGGTLARIGTGRNRTQPTFAIPLLKAIAFDVVHLQHADILCSLRNGMHMHTEQPARGARGKRRPE